MPRIKFLRTAPGVAAAVAIVVAGSAGAYALTNWFNGNVAVTQTDASVLSVDLSACKDEPLPGVGHPSTSVKFKILKQPAISASQLQQKLQADCEYNATNTFYQTKMPGAFKDGGVAQGYFNGAAKIDAINADGTITLSYAPGGAKTLPIASDATVFDKGKSAAMADLHVGDTVVAWTHSASAQTTPVNGDTPDPFSGDASVISIFKTQYDATSRPSSIKGFYDAYNIMPLEWYDQLNK